MDTDSGVDLESKKLFKFTAGWLLLLNEIILFEVEKVRICRRRLVVLKSKRSDWAYRSNPLQIPINA